MTEVMERTPKLIVKHRGGVVKECALTQSTFTIGRKADNDLVIEDSAVSGHHARIVKIQAVYFIEDLESTNGILINGHKIDRRQLRDADVVTIGKHRLVFLEEAKNLTAQALPDFEGSDKTVSLKSGTYESPPRMQRKVGMVQIISGRTNRTEYKLTRKLTIIGSQPDAFIKLTGYFAPKNAAMIGRREEGYYVTVAGKTKQVQLNSLNVKGQADLKDGDILEVAGVTMQFYLKDAA